MNDESPVQAVPDSAWFKSSYSSGEGGECVEVAAWFKSSYSAGNGGECVEVASCVDTVHVRDSKNKAGPTLSLTPSGWSAFVDFAAQR